MGCNHSLFWVDSSCLENKNIGHMSASWRQWLIASKAGDIIWKACPSNTTILKDHQTLIRLMDQLVLIRAQTRWMRLGLFQSINPNIKYNPRKANIVGDTSSWSQRESLKTLNRPTKPQQLLWWRCQRRKWSWIYNNVGNEFKRTKKRSQTMDSINRVATGMPLWPNATQIPRIACFEDGWQTQVGSSLVLEPNGPQGITWHPYSDTFRHA